MALLIALLSLLALLYLAAAYFFRYTFARADRVPQEYYDMFITEIRKRISYEQ